MPWESFDSAGKPVIAGGGASGVPCVKALRSAAQSVNDSTVTYIALNDADAFDTDNMHDPSSNNTRITFNTAGVYQISAEAQYASSALGNRYLLFDANGTSTRVATQNQSATVGSTPVIECTALAKFAVNEYVEVGIFQDSGGALDISNVKAMAVRVAAG